MTVQKPNQNADSTGVRNPSEIPMTPWYDPRQLLTTALQVMVSGLFTHHADRRAFFTEWNEDNVKPLIDFEKKKVNNLSEEEFWFDFVADTGDGGNSTYAVASQLLANEINVSINEGLEIDINSNASVAALNKDSLLTLPRGEALILGGDLVYPIASELEYNKKFINIFKAALPKKIQNEIKDPSFKPKRHVFAFPQNHDWYDSLASFSQIFGGVGDKFLDMHCQQRQSYNAVKLINDWWLFGIDLALSGDIDELQFEYFRKIIEGYNDNGTEVLGLTTNSNVIIVYPEPVWTKAAFGEPRNRGTYRFEQLEVEIEKKTGKDITIRLAGDQHHYRRYSTSNSQQHMITCGCGGAFLHPTHGPDKIDEIVHIRRFKTLDMPRQFRFKDDKAAEIHDQINKKVIKEEDLIYFKTDDNSRNFPNRKTSLQLSHDNFKAFFDNNWSFGILTSLSYFLIVWLVFVSLHTNIKNANLVSWWTGKPLMENDFSQLWQAFEAWGWAVLLSPTSLLLMMAILAGFYGFTKSFNAHYPGSGLVGLVHGVVHLSLVFFCYWFVLKINGIFASFFGTTFSVNPITDEIRIFPFLTIGGEMLVLGWLVGSAVMGAYLFVTLNLHRRFKNFPLLHSNEAFSSLKIADYKGFLRFRITNRGNTDGGKSESKLEAFFIGLETVPHGWYEDKQDPLKPTWVAQGNSTLKPVLYDYWVVKPDRLG